MQAELAQGFGMTIEPQGATRSPSVSTEEGDFGHEMSRVEKESEVTSRPHSLRQDESQAGERSGKEGVVPEDNHQRLQSRLGTARDVDLQDVLQDDSQGIETAAQWSQTPISMESEKQDDEERLSELEQNKVLVTSTTEADTRPVWTDASTVGEEKNPLIDLNGQVQNTTLNEPLSDHVEEGSERLLSLERNIAKFSVQEDEPPITNSDHDVADPGKRRPASLEENLLRFSDQESRASQVMGHRQGGTEQPAEGMPFLEETFTEFHDQKRKVAQGVSSQDARIVTNQEVPEGFVEKRQAVNPVSSLNNYLTRLTHQRGDDRSHHVQNMTIKDDPHGNNMDVHTRKLPQDGDKTDVMNRADNLLNRIPELRQGLENPALFMNEGSSKTSGEMFAFASSTGNVGVETPQPMTAFTQAGNFSSYVMDSDNRQGVMDQVVSQLRVMKTKDKDTMTLQLHPANLGKMKMHITVQDQRVVAEITTDSTVVRDIISSQLHVLKESLMEQGLNLDRMEVHLQQNDLGNHAEHSKHTFQEDFQHEWKGETVSENQEETALIHSNEGISISQGRVNLIA